MNGFFKFLGIVVLCVFALAAILWVTYWLIIIAAIGGILYVGLKAFIEDRKARIEEYKISAFASLGGSSHGSQTNSAGTNITTNTDPRVLYYLDSIARAQDNIAQSQQELIRLQNTDIGLQKFGLGVDIVRAIYEIRDIRDRKKLPVIMDRLIERNKNNFLNKGDLYARRY